MKKVLMTGSDQLSQKAKNIYKKVLLDAMPEVSFSIEDRIVPREELISLLQDVDVLVTWDQPIDEDLLRKVQLKGICFPSIGYNCVDVEAATKHHVYVTNVPDYCLDEVTNHTLMLILSIWRKLKIASAVDQHTWEVVHLGTIHRLEGSTLGIVGVGKIGRLLAKKLAPFGLRLVGTDPWVSKEEMAKFQVEKMDLNQLLQESDLVSLHCDLNDSSFHLLGEEEFSLMKPHSYLINTSRGAVVHEKALMEAIEKGKIAGCAIDVVDPEPPSKELLAFSKRDNVLVTPHMAYFSQEANEEQVTRAAWDTLRILQGQRPDNPVNSFD